MIDKLDFSNLTIIFITGVIFGSFLNVVIFRLPKSLSIIKPASHWSNCSENLKWYENIPLISFILLKGSCSYCKTKISIQYPLIEIINGLLFLAIAYFSKDISQFIVFSLVGMTLLSLVIIDFRYYILPDLLILISLVIVIAYFGYNEKLKVFPRFYYAILAGFGMYILRLLTSRLYKKETFGLGDVKITFLIGFMIGSLDAFIAIFFGFFIAAVLFAFLIMLRVQKRDSYLPFGPYLVFGMVLYLIYNKDFMI